MTSLQGMVPLDDLMSMECGHKSCSKQQAVIDIIDTFILFWWHIRMNYWFPKFQKPSLAWGNDLPEFQHSLPPSSQKTVCPWGTYIEFVSSLIFWDLGRVATLEEGKLISAPHFEAWSLTLYEHMKENKAQWKQNLGG